MLMQTDSGFKVEVETITVMDAGFDPLMGGVINIGVGGEDFSGVSINSGSEKAVWGVDPEAFDNATLHNLSKVTGKEGFNAVIFSEKVDDNYRFFSTGRAGEILELIRPKLDELVGAGNYQAQVVDKKLVIWKNESENLAPIGENNLIVDLVKEPDARSMSAGFSENKSNSYTALSYILLNLPEDKIAPQLVTFKPVKFSLNTVGGV